MGLRLLGKDCHWLASPVMKDGRPTLENYALVKSSGSGNGLSDTTIGFVQSSVQELTDFPKDVLKQAILHHEIMFRKQVLELHRLYWTQKNLMNDLSWRDFDRNMLSRDNQIINQFTEIKFVIPNSPAINSTLAESEGIFQECLAHTPHTTSKLQLSVEDPIKSADTECLRIQNSFYCKACGVSEPEELELTLGNNQGKNERSGAGKTYYGKECLISSKGRHPFRGCFSTSRFTQEPGLTPDSPRNFDLNKTFEDLSEISQNLVNPPSSASSSTAPEILSGPHITAVATSTSLRESSNKSSEETSDVLQACDRNFGAKDAEFLACGYGSNQYSKHGFVERMELDGCAWTCSKDEDNPVTTRCNSESISDPQGKSKKENSGSLRGNVLTTANVSPSLSPGLFQLSNEDTDKLLVFPGCCIQNERKNISTRSIVNEKRCNSLSSIWNSNLPQKASAYSEIKQLSGERSEEDTLSSSPCGNLMSVEGATFVPSMEMQEEPNGSDPVGEKTDPIDRNKACGGRNSEVERHNVLSMDDYSQSSQIGLYVIQKYSGKQDVDTETDDHISLDVKSCSYSESNDNCQDKGETHEMVVDCHILKAAESLIHISLQSTASPSDKIGNMGQLVVENEELNDEPQNSSDSFELMVLTLKETVNDEYSKPARLSKEETENYKCRFKLRNGRGLWDFQREILPGLVSLSRQEICKDLQTIVEAVRLDELRYGPKKFSRGNSSTPVRSRRLRRSYVGKRV